MQRVPLEALDVENVPFMTVQHDIIETEHVSAQATAFAFVINICQRLGQLLTFLYHASPPLMLLKTPDSIVLHCAQNWKIAKVMLR